nr:hypothetical protein [Tanacetum cinerariifolium]
MVVILEKGEFNSDFHPMVDFIAASPLRIETTDEEIHILATVDGIQRTVYESSLRRNLKLRDEDGIVSIPDTELFENLTLMGKFSQNQKLTFQKGKFSHQWKYLIHTIMQCLSPKSTEFNEFSSNIATALICLATNRTYNFSKMIFDGMVKNFLTKKLFTTLWVNSPSFSGRILPFFDTMLIHQGEGSCTPTKPPHTPFPEADTSHPTTSSIPLPSIPTALIPHVTQPDPTPIRQYSRRARIAQSSALPTVADKPASPVRDVSKGEACPTDSSFKADQDRATIAKSSTLPHDSAPRVTSLAANEGSVTSKQSGDDAPIKGRSINEREATVERISNDSEEIARVLTSIDAAIVLAGGIDVPTGSGFIPTVGPPATIISTGSEVGPTASLIAIRRKGKEVMVEFDTPKKKRLQEQIDAQVARELEEQQEKEVMRMNEQIAKDAKVARIHAEEELQEMIDSLDKSHETIAKLKRKGLNLEHEQVKKQKSSEEAPMIETSTEEFTEEKMKEMMHKGEACLTESGFIADQDRATIAKTSTLPYDLAPRVTSPAADEGSMLKERVQALEDREGVAAKQSRDNAPIKGRSINEGEAAAERISNDSEDISRVLTSMDATIVLAGGIDVPTGSGFIPTAGPPATVISTSSEIARDAEMVRIHAEEELQGMIDSLDKSNETIAKYLQEYQDFASELPLEKRIELISDLVKYQDNYSKVKDFKGMTFEEIEAKFAEVWKQVEDFIPIGSKEETERLKRNGLNLEHEQVKKQKSSEEAPEIETSTEEFTEEKMKEMMQLVPVEDVYVQALQVKHPIIDWKVHTEGQRSYWKIIRLGGSFACYQLFVDLIKQLDREDLNQLWALVKEYLSIRPATSEKEMELWVELKRMYEPDPEYQLWTLTRNFMHEPVEWKLYDLSGVHHLTAKEKEIFMLVEKDYPLRKGLALIMISYKLQVENYSQMAEDLIKKIYNIANTLR